MNDLDHDDTNATAESSSRPPGPACTPPPLPPAGDGRMRPRRVGCLLAAGVVSGLLLLSLVLFGAVLNRIGGTVHSFLASEDPAQRGDFGVDEFPRMQELWSAGQGDRKAVRIPLQGGIFLGGGGGLHGGSGAEFALRAIRRATLDPDVTAILLEVDSGGGGMTASDILYDALQGFRRAGTNRIVVAHMGDVAASGAYYVSLAADCIVAHPTTITGSIGVILSSLNISELARRLGIEDDSVTSADGKQSLSPLIEKSPEQRAVLQGLVDSLHRRFVDLVAERRNLDRPHVERLADGRIVLADEALRLGLIDRVGYLADAQSEVARLLGVETVRFVRYSQRTPWTELLRSPGFWGAVLSDALPGLQRALPPTLGIPR